MTKDLVNQIYEQLLIIGCCGSRSDFSTAWLGMDEGYYSSIMSRHETISVRAQAHLTATLRNVGMSFGGSGVDFVVPKGHMMVDLHSRLLEDLFRRVVMEAQAACSG